MNHTQWRKVFAERGSNTHRMAQAIVDSMGGYRKNAHLSKYTDDIDSLTQALNVMIEWGRADKAREINGYSSPTDAKPPQQTKA